MTSTTPATTDVGALADELVKAIQVTISTRDSSGRVTRTNLMPDHRNLIDAALRKSALQETQGDEPVAWANADTSEPPFAYRFEYADKSAFEIMEDGRYFSVKPDGKREERRGKITSNIRRLIGRAIILRSRAAPQQSPRLEREGIARKLKEMGFTSRDGTVINGGTFGVIDAILALLSSSGTTVVTSTEHSDPTKYRGTFLGYRNDKGEEMHCANAFCPHQDKCQKGCICPKPIAPSPAPPPD